MPEVESYIFVDAKPDETLEPSKKRQHFFVAIMCDSETGVEGLQTDFKNTKRKNKIKRAKLISEALEARSPIVVANVLTGTSNKLMPKWSADIINEIRELIGAEWKLEDKRPKSLIWDGREFSLKSAMGTIFYSGILPILCLRFVTLARKRDTKTKFNVILDRLPGNGADAMKLMHAISANSDVMEMWNSNKKHGCDFFIANLGEFKNSKGESLPGKRHPLSILVDWIAVGAVASYAPKQLLKDCAYTNEEMDAFSDIWESLCQYGDGKITDIDNMPKEFLNYVGVKDANNTLDYSPPQETVSNFQFKPKQLALAGLGAIVVGGLGAFGTDIYNWAASHFREGSEPTIRAPVVSSGNCSEPSGSSPSNCNPEEVGGTGSNQNISYPKPSTKSERVNAVELKPESGRGYVYYGMEIFGKRAARVDGGNLNLAKDGSLPRLESLKVGEMLQTESDQFLRSLPTKSAGYKISQPEGTCLKILEGRRYFIKHQTATISKGWVPVERTNCDSIYENESKDSVANGSMQ